jgi:hypothetical protein
MARWTIRALLLLVLTSASCAFPQQAQESKIIKIRIFDSKTGKPVAPTGFMIRVDHQRTVHGDWVTQNEDGSGDLAVPIDATAVSIHESYDNSMEIYINCDTEKHKGALGDIWYSIADIMSKGFVAENGCGKAKDIAKLAIPAPEPGVIVLYVRPLNWHESGLER